MTENCYNREILYSKMSLQDEICKKYKCIIYKIYMNILMHKINEIAYTICPKSCRTFKTL